MVHAWPVLRCIGLVQVASDWQNLHTLAGRISALDKTPAHPGDTLALWRFPRAASTRSRTFLEASPVQGFIILQHQIIVDKYNNNSIIFYIISFINRDIKNNV